ncbi:MAG: hypothetical protein GEV11_00615 [Streptosporangiales bacterium]|nr:hypothetical protein [Streptosporangiales bacterium]
MNACSATGRSPRSASPRPRPRRTAGSRRAEGSASSPGTATRTPTRTTGPSASASTKRTGSGSGVCCDPGGRSTPSRSTRSFRCWRSGRATTTAGSPSRANCS